MHEHPTSTIERLHRRPGPPDAPPTARCADLAEAVGQLDAADDLFTGSLLSAAVSEIAALSGRQWNLEPTTHPALLLRALAVLSIGAPDAPSPSARVLLDAHQSMRGAS